MTLGTKVKVKIGRNAGQKGVVKEVVGNNILVDFGGTIRVNEGFGSTSEYPDTYWVQKRFVEVVDQPAS